MRKVSIIIPCYNCAALVAETLDSLAKQTVQDFEVVCINDGSTDNTLAILEAWKQKGLFDMQIISKPNGGVSRARNAGIKAAEGEYLLFLDSDDLYHPAFIEQLCGAIAEHKADVAYCWLSRDHKSVFANEKKAEFIDQSQEEAMHNLLFRMPDVGFYCYLYRRELIRDLDLKFDENTRRFEDREFNWKYLCHCKTAVLIDAPLYYYRVNAASVTQNKKIEWKTERLDAVRRVEDYMEQMQCMQEHQNCL
jgi:glycosyltransferase involved in cell wall biosynthesis